MPIPQLKVRSISRFRDAAGLCKPAEDGRAGDGAKIDLGNGVLGQDARDVLDEAAAGDMGERLDRRGISRSAVSTGFT